LSPAYDVNPNEYGTGLHLNITEDDNALELPLVLSVAKYFRISAARAEEIIEQVKASVNTWKAVATKYNLSRAEQERMGNCIYIGIIDGLSFSKL